ncbi:LOW QUALITY PROTEIN: DUF3741-associated sequence motif, partial [Dillenia turbinata]
ELGNSKHAKRSAHGINRSQTRKETSNQIVTLGRGQRPEQIGVLSIALAFALENGGKNIGMESSGNMETVNIDRRSKLDRHQISTCFPALSHLHLQEISRGAQKLNQILKACSSGFNIDRHSIEIGKELLKGAMELEESLRMLVNLQEASEFMISPHFRGRIGSGCLMLTKMMMKAALGEETSHPAKVFLQQAIKDSSGHLRSHEGWLQSKYNGSHISYSSKSYKYENFICNDSTKGHCGPSPKEDKGRIPNVIAKLMGLDELPQKRHSKNIGQTEISSKKVTEQMVLKTTASRTNKNDEIKKVTEDLATQKSRQNGVQNKRVPVTLSKVLELQAEENQVKENTTLKSTVQHLESTEGTKLVAGSKKETLKRNNQANSKIPLTVITGNQEHKQENEKRQDTVKLNECKGMEVARPEVQVLKGELQEIESWQPITEPANAMCEPTDKREHMLQTEKRNAFTGQSTKKPTKILHFSSHKSSETLNHKKKSIKQKRLSRKANIMSSKVFTKITGDAPNFQKKLLRLDKPTARKTGSREGISTILSQGTPNSIKKNIAKDLTATDQVGKNDSTHRGMDENTLAVNLKAKSETNKASFPTVIKLKSANLFPTNQKVNNIKANKNEIPQKIAEVMTRNLDRFASLQVY